MIEKKKHCIVVTCFHEAQPGFLDFSYRISALAKEYQITVISHFSLTQSELRVDSADYQVFSMGHGKLGWLHYIFQSARYIRRTQPQVVMLLHSSVAPVSLLIGNIPSCLYWNEHPTNLIHTPTSFSPIRYVLAKWSQALVFMGARKASIVMPIGEEHERDLSRHRVSRAKMIYMGVDNRFLNHVLDSTKTNLDQETVRLVYVGTISKTRGRDVMIDAMAIVAKSNVKAHLTMIGATDDELRFCLARVAELNISGSVTVIGRIPGNEIPQYLHQSDVGICLWEQTPWNEFNPPTKLFEYLVSGLAVLASNIRTHTRYVQNWQNGLIFEYEASSLAQSISDLYLNRSKIAYLKQSAAVSGKQHLWSKIEPMFLNEVRKVANN